MTPAGLYALTGLGRLEAFNLRSCLDLDQPDALRALTALTGVHPPPFHHLHRASNRRGVL